DRVRAPARSRGRHQRRPVGWRRDMGRRRGGEEVRARQARRHDRPRYLGPLRQLRSTGPPGLHHLERELSGKNVPGLLLCTAIAAGAYELHALLPAPIEAMLIAIVIGMVIRNTIGMPARFAPGIKASVHGL